MPLPIDRRYPIDYYAWRQAPQNYLCGGKKCKNKQKPNIKLWRLFGNFDPAKQQLRCCDCAAEAEKVDISTMDNNGRYWDAFQSVTTIIGSGYVPAIPIADNTAFWSARSVPAHALTWWERLPLR